MYCPQCATPHTDGAKFCRSCGLGLEAVALVLSGRSVQPAKAGRKESQPQTTQDWLEKHSEGVSRISKGAALLAVTMLIGVAMALFMPSHVPWILIWIGVFGWMAIWGGIELASGISGVIAAKSRLRLLGPAGKEDIMASTPQPLSPAGEPPTMTNPAAALRSPPAGGVTEGTTRRLDDVVKK